MISTTLMILHAKSTRGFMKEDSKTEDDASIYILGWVDLTITNDMPINSDLIS